MSIPSTSAYDAVKVFRTWLKAMATAAGLTDAQVVWADRLDSVRPPLPYVTLRLTSERATGEPEEIRDLDAGVPRVYSREPREALVSVQVYGDTGAEWLERAMASRNQPASLALLSTVTVRPSGGLRNVSAILDGASTEQRWSMDVLLTYMRSTLLLTPESQTALAEVAVTGDAQTLPLAQSDPDALPLSLTAP